MNLNRMLIGLALSGGIAMVTASQFHLMDRSPQPRGIEPEMPAEVRAVLERSCYDCHSNQTEWPWYSHVAPMSWLIENDVVEGRRDLDLTAWDEYDEDDQLDRVEEIVAEVEDGHMPPVQYTLMNRDAVLSTEEIALIRDWVDGWDATTTARTPGPEVHRQ